MSRAVALLLALFLTAPASADKPTPEQVRQAIKDLGDRQFAVREKAEKLLWQAGVDAEEPLRAALSSSDGEVVRRAKALLDKFDWGIFPDTSPEVVEQIGLFRNGEKPTRLAAVTKLMAMGKPGFSAVKRLADMERNASDRQALFAQMAQEAQRALPGLLAEGDIPAVEDLLDRCLLAGSEEAFTSYAAFQALTGKLPQAIARWEQDWAKSKSMTSGMTLVHLFRAKGDFTRARETAAKLKNDSLLEQVLWEEGNWKELAARPKKMDEPRDAATLGLRAAIFHLAGDRAAFDAVVEKLVAICKSNDRVEAGSATEALLLNGRFREALPVGKGTPSFAFDLLCAQLRYKDALALGDSVRVDEKEERFRLGLGRAVALHRVGQKEKAVALFAELGSGLKESADLSSARELVRAMVKLNLREQAAEQAAHYLEYLRKQDVRLGWDEVLDPIFDDNADVAATWWRFLRTRHDDAASAMRTVRRILDGPPPGELAEWATALADQAPGRDELSSTGDSRSFTWPAFATAAAMMRAGREDKAREYVDKAMAQQPDFTVPLRYADWLTKRGKHADAAIWYARAAKIAPSHSLPIFLQGHALKRSGNEKEGTRLIELAHRMPLGNEFDRGKFAAELHDRGYHDDARCECDLVLTLGWHRYGNVGSVLNLAYRYAERAGEYDRAAALLDRSLAGMLKFGLSFVDRSHYLAAPTSLRRLRAETLLKEGNLADAVREVNDVFALLPSDVEFVITSVVALDQAGREQDADAVYAAALKRYEELARDYPASAFFHNRCGWLAAASGRDLDKALEHATTAVRLDPSSDTYLDTLAEVQFRRGDAAKAIELMRKCCAMQPERGYYAAQLARFTKGDRGAPIPRDE
jgi:tetratricopeptide (TPR) repeat protein